MRIPTADESDDDDDDDDDDDNDDDDENNDSTHEEAGGGSESLREGDPAALEAAFAAAGEAAKEGLPPSLPRDAKLRLYALYKQATVGNAPELCPAGRFDAAGRYKWASWDALRGTASGAAKLRYVLEVRACRQTSRGGANASGPAGHNAADASSGTALSAPPGAAEATGATHGPAASSGGMPAAASALAGAPAALPGPSEWATSGSDWVLLAPEVLLLKVAAKGIFSAAKERTTIGRVAVRLAGLPWELVDYACSLLPGGGKKA